MDNFKKTAARETARILLDTEAVLIRPDNPFTLTSGRKSPVYVDCRKLISFPAERTKLMEMMVQMIQENLPADQRPELVAGGETAGIPYAAWISQLMNLPMLYVRKKPKGFGRTAQIEGDMPVGKNVLLIEDMATDGGSKMLFVDALREAGAETQHCAVLFHYGIFPKGLKELQDNGISLHALTTWWDIFAFAEESKRFDPATLAKLKGFLDAPDAWNG
ncbi:MAG: orotate phosphoribosyltransferase [Alphaproteobacteria bacterium]